MIQLFAVAAWLAIGLQLQPPLKPAIQHVTVATSTTPQTTAPSGKVTLLVDVTPNRNVHVYAPGAKDFVVASLKMSPASRVAFGTATYPPSELVLDPILNERIPQYTKTFRIAQPLTLSAAAKSGETVSVVGVLTYQACGDKMCFAPSTLPVQWTVVVK